MAKNWKNFLPQTNAETTQDQDSSTIASEMNNGQNLQQALNSLGIKNDELQSLLNERDELEQTMKGLTQSGSDDDSKSRRYEQYIPSFKEKKEAEKQWQAFRDKQASKKLRERQLNKIKAKTAFSDTDEQTDYSENEASRFSDLNVSADRKKKNEEGLRKPKSLADLKLANLKLPDSDELRKKLIEKKQEGLNLISKEKKTKALQSLRIAQQKIDTIEKTVKRVSDYTQKTSKRLSDYTQKAKTETKKIEKKLNEVKDYYKKLDSLIKQSGNAEAAKNLDKASELIGSDKLQALKNVGEKASALKEKVVNPINESWEKLNEKKRELLSIKSRFQKKADQLLSSVKETQTSFDEKREQLKKVLDQKKEFEKVDKAKPSKEKETVKEKEKAPTSEKEKEKPAPKENEKDKRSEREEERKRNESWEAKRERKREERRERKKNQEY